MPTDTYQIKYFTFGIPKTIREDEVNKSRLINLLRNPHMVVVEAKRLPSLYDLPESSHGN